MKKLEKQCGKETTDTMESNLPIILGPKCNYTLVGATFDESLTGAEWKEYGRRLQQVKSCYQFLLGDWLNFGERKYGEKYTDGIEESTGLERGHLRNVASVCARVQLSLRNYNLEWNHHVVVAPLGADEQAHYLRLADEECLSVAKLRERIRKDKGEFVNENTGKGETWVFDNWLTDGLRHITDQEVQRWNAEQRARAKVQLEPLMRIYETL